MDGGDDHGVGAVETALQSTFVVVVGGVVFHPVGEGPVLALGLRSVVDGLEVGDDFAEHAEVVVDGRARADLARVGDVVLHQPHGLEEVQVDLLQAFEQPFLILIEEVGQGVDGTVHVVFGDAEVGVQPQISQQRAAQIAVDVLEDAACGLDFRLFKQLLNTTHDEGDVVFSQGVHERSGILADAAHEDGHVRIG